MKFQNPSKFTISLISASLSRRRDQRLLGAHSNTTSDFHVRLFRIQKRQSISYCFYFTQISAANKFNPQLNEIRLFFISLIR